MMHQSVNGRDGHHRVSKDTIPITKRLVGGNQQTFALIAMSNQFKQHRGFRFGLFDVTQIVHHHQIITV